MKGKKEKVEKSDREMVVFRNSEEPRFLMVQYQFVPDRYVLEQEVLDVPSLGRFVLLHDASLGLGGAINPDRGVA